ncbi:MAG: Glutaredoxin [Candidatus Paceibacter sp.]|jgi:hypothetical protein|nr:Glutaredoxin [Candidatus Paceibacter sp.]
MPYKKYHQITIYVSRGNKLDDMARMYFRAEGHDFLEKDVTRDQNSMIKMEEISSQKNTPVVEIDGRVIVGYRPDIYDLILAGKNADELGG